MRRTWNKQVEEDSVKVGLRREDELEMEDEKDVE